jgi:hypothetical protein
MTDFQFGPLKGQPDVEKAVLSTLAAWLNEYLADIERKNGYAKKLLGRAPSPQSIHGGVDFQSWNEEELPAVIVVANPTGAPEYAQSIGYTQTYEVQVGCIVAGDGAAFSSAPTEVLAEDEARTLAGYWGVAVQLLVQHGDLKSFAERTRMVGAPRVEIAESAAGTEQRRIQQSVTTFHVTVPQIIEENAGPYGQTPAESPGYGGEPEAPYAQLPEVKKTTETIKAKTPSEP